MHVASLVFVGRGCCKNLMKSRMPGLLDLRQGAYSRETQTAAYAESSRWGVLWDALGTLNSGIAASIRLRQGSELPVRWWYRDSFRRAKTGKVDNSVDTKKVGHVAPSYDTSMSSSHREESNAGLFENFRVL